ncbi:MAG: glycosyltransferase family 2 protein [Ignavibacteriales bacterium]|nr:glycosyltransferase family 2 protein [Ignavibacteriales bacterium]
MDRISVIVPCRNEGKYILDFIGSILSNDYPKEDMEIFLIDGRSTDNTQIIVKDYENKFDFIKLLINESRTVPFALNMGIRASTGKYIIRLDAHSQIPNNYFSELIRWAKELNTDNIGTICITDVKNNNPKSNAIKKVLSNRFGVGNSFFRIGVNEIMEVDHVPFGCYKSEVFATYGFFNEKLNRNQDIELNKRISSNGGRIFLIPNIFSIYFARETYLALAQNNYNNGLWNILTVYVTKKIKSLSLRHFIPLLFILSLTLPLLLSFWFPILRAIPVLSLFSYLCLITLVSLKINDKTTSFFHVLFAFFTLHFSYALGSITGLFKINYLWND